MYFDALCAALLIGLASAAVWRLIAVDVISKRVRELLWGEEAPDSRVRDWLKAWGKCPWCSGAWITALITIVTAIVIDLPAPVLVFAAARFVTGYIGSHDEDYVSQQMEGAA